MKPVVDTVIEKRGDYTVVVVEGDGTGEYAVINSRYGVVEASTPILAQALQYLDQLRAGVDAFYDEQELVADAIADEDDPVH